MSSLSPLWARRPRAQQQPAKDRASVFANVIVAAPAPVTEQAPVSVPSVFAPSAPAAPQPRIAIENLTPADVRDLSTATINALVPLNPKLVGQLIIDAGKRRRNEPPMNTPTMRPLSRCILIAGAKRRSEPISDADEEFLCAYLDEIAS
jgi:hypothetical protein